MNRDLLIFFICIEIAVFTVGQIEKTATKSKKMRILYVYFITEAVGDQLISASCNQEVIYGAEPFECEYRRRGSAKMISDEKI